MHDYLKNWRTLCKFVRTATEEDCVALLAMEQEGAARLGFIKRIHSRLNAVRAARERKELGV